MIKRNIAFIISSTIILVLLCASLAFSADIQGANTTITGSSTGTPLTASTAIGVGGNLTSVNISGSAVTDRWVGFYGNISGIVRLADATGNRFFQWTVTEITGSVVYATNGTVSNWSTLAPATYDTMPAYLQQSAADNYSTTFTLNEAFTTNLRTVNGVDYAYTLNNSGEDSAFKTYAMTTDLDAVNDDNSTIVFAGKAVQQSNAFDNGTVDFQIIAPARTLTTYYFYLELP